VSDVQQYSDPDSSSPKLGSSSLPIISSSKLSLLIAAQAAFTWKKVCEQDDDITQTVECRNAYSQHIIMGTAVIWMDRKCSTVICPTHLAPGGSGLDAQDFIVGPFI
jgi:hypothetical protein